MILEELDRDVASFMPFGVNMPSRGEATSALDEKSQDKMMDWSSMKCRRSPS
jgi:hypothetical protein